MTDKEENYFDYDQEPGFIDYFKEHNALLVAGISGIIAILSFLANALSYISLRISIQEYLLFPEMIKDSGQGRVFIYIIVLIAYCFIIFFSVFIIRHFFNQHIVFSSFEKFTTLYEKKNKYISDDIPIKTIKQSKRIHLVNTFYKVLGCVVVIIVTDLLFEATQGFLLDFSPMLIISSLFVSLGGAIGIALFESQKYRKREIETIVKNIAKVKDEELREKEYNKYYTMFFNAAYNPEKHKLRASKMNIKYSLMSSVAAVITAFFSILSSSTILAKSKRLYQIYHDNGKNYAVVYQDTNYYVLDEAIIRDNDLYILINSQRFMITDDISFEYRSFDHVIKGGKPYTQRETTIEKEEDSIEIYDNAMNDSKLDESTE